MPSTMQVLRIESRGRDGPCLKVACSVVGKQALEEKTPRQSAESNEGCVHIGSGGGARHCYACIRCYWV